MSEPFCLSAFQDRVYTLVFVKYFLVEGELNISPISPLVDYTLEIDARKIFRLLVPSLDFTNYRSSLAIAISETRVSARRRGGLISGRILFEGCALASDKLKPWVRCVITIGNFEKKKKEKEIVRVAGRSLIPDRRKRGGFLIDRLSVARLAWFSGTVA